MFVRDDMTAMVVHKATSRCTYAPVGGTGRLSGPKSADNGIQIKLVLAA